MEKTPAPEAKKTRVADEAKPRRAAQEAGQLLTDPYAWIERQTTVQSTADVKVPERLIDHVIGQDLAVAVAHKAAQQKRHLLLIGDPGTGKSMIAKAMSEMLPPEKLNDVLSYNNPRDPNQPKIMTVEAGHGRKVIAKMRRRARRQKVVGLFLQWVFLIGVIGLGVYYLLRDGDLKSGDPQPLLIGLLVVLVAATFFRGMKDPVVFAVPKLLMEHDPKKENHAPYVDATGSHAGALLGDVRHDPFQSGGLETPTHERVEVGAIHRAQKGILFIDEINVLRLESQQSLLTAMQDRLFSIVGQSQTSSGAMVRTEPVPCEFILVAAGNLDAVQPPDGSHRGMHPALRSRIRGYGYEVYVNNVMPDTHDNRMKLVRFVAQEVVRDGRIPHFARDSIAEVILEAQRRSGHRGKLTLRLRELGGLVRTAGDIATGKQHPLVTPEDVREAKSLSRSLEQQIANAELEGRRAHHPIEITREAIGVAIGSGLVGTGEVGEPAGLVVPVATAVTAPLSSSTGHLAFGGGLRESAAGQTETVTALLKSVAGEAMARQDVHLQSLVPQQGVDSEGVGVALAVSALSALERVPVRQDVLLIGSITVTGDLRPVRGVTQQMEAAVDMGYHTAIVPEQNRSDVLLNPAYRDRIQVLFASDLAGVLEHVLSGPKRAEIIGRLRRGGSSKTAAANGHSRLRQPLKATQ